MKRQLYTYIFEIETGPSNSRALSILHVSIGIATTHIPHFSHTRIAIHKKTYT